MRRARVAWLAGVALLALGSTALAMHMRFATGVRGWSRDGTAALLEIDGSGPEGGSNQRIELLEPSGASTLAETTNTLSNGSGPRASERVTHAQCLADLKRVEARLKALGFAGLALDAGPCRISGAGEASQELSVSTEKGRVVISLSGRPVASFESNEPDEDLVAQGSPSGRAVVVSSELVPVLAYLTPAKGNFEELHPVQPRQQ